MHSDKRGPASTEESRSANGPATVVGPSAYSKAKLDNALESSQRFMNLGLFSAALDDCYEAIGWLPTYLPTHVRIGEIYAASGHIAAAIEEFSVIAAVFEARDDLSGACEMHRKIVGLAGDDAGERRKLVRLLTRSSQTNEAVDQQLLLAERSVRAGEKSDAIADFQEAIRLAPGKIEPVCRFAGALSQLHQAGAAKGDSAEAGLDDRSFCLSIANQLLADQNWPDAIFILEALAPIGPEDETTYLKLAEAQFRQGNLCQAIESFDRLAGVLYTGGKRQKAHDLYRVMKDLAPEMPLPHLRLGNAYAGEGREAEAAVEYMAWAELLFEEGKAVETIETLKKTLEAVPDDAPARARLNAIQSLCGAQDNAQ